MAFRRVRRRMSTLASGSNNRKSRATTQARSVSGHSTCSNDSTPTDEYLAGRTRKRRQSITFDRLLTSDEAREELALAQKLNSLSELHNKAVPVQIRDHKDRATSGNAAERTLSLPKGPTASRTAAAGPSVEALPSGSSNQRTTIFGGKPKDIATQQLQEQVNDETRLEAEQNYYESTDAAGTSRRRSMLRSVSKDDYLLARGANPRTGIVTPGIHGSASSQEEAEILKQRGIAPPSKWRQRGDQWVSLDVGEPTPIPSQPKGSRTHHAGRALRTPPRLTAGKYNHESGSKTPYQKSSITAALPEDMPTPDGLPGTFPISPQKDLDNPSIMSRLAAMPVIKRKPVGILPRENDGHAAPKQVTSQESTDTVVKHPFAIQPRSSSAPAQQSMHFDTPDDVGRDTSKALPSVPVAQKYAFDGTGQHIAIQKSFLGRGGRPKWTGDVQESTISAFSRSEKELPCLPTSSGQSQSQVYQEVLLESSNLKNPRSEPRRLMGPQGCDPTYPFVRNMRMALPQRQYQNTPNTSTGINSSKLLMQIPTYDNPPSQMAVLPRPTRRAIGGPRPIYQHRSISENIKKASEINTGPSAIMYTNTHIPTHIPTLQPKPQLLHRTAQDIDMSKERRTYQPIHDRIYSNDPRLRSGNTSDEALMKMFQGRTCAQSRPQMPDRADAQMRSIPRTNARRRHHQDFTDNHRHRRMTGTSEDALSERSEISAANTAKLNVDQMLTPNMSRSIVNGRDTVTPTSSRNNRTPNTSLKEVEMNGNEPGDHLAQSNGLPRKCSQCHNGFVVGSPRGTIGRIPRLKPATIAEEVKESTGPTLQQKKFEDDHPIKEMTAVLNSVSIEGEVDERDHTACCIECCTVEDCHEGCLGHPSPSIRSFDGSTIVDGIEGPSALERGSSLSSSATSTPPSPSKDKLSFAQGLRMRKTLRTRQCPDDGKTIKERCNTLDSLPIELDSHPLSPASFWGGGEGAVTAAKKALVAKNCSATTPAPRSKIATSAANANEVERVVSPLSLVVPKVRELRGRNASKSSSTPSTSRASGIRNISGASNVSADKSASRSRNASGASMLSIEIPHLFSNLGTINVASVLEMVRVPFEALAMWVQTHPEAQQWLWKCAERAIEMGKTVVRTGETVWEVSYVYSKTGRLRCKNLGGIPRLALDCGRSVGYLLLFVALAICVGRMLGFVLGLAQGVFWVVRAIGWLLKKLGLGLLW